MTQNTNSDIEMKCSVTAVSSASSQFAVTWLLQERAENKTILSLDRNALVTFGPQTELKSRQRISTRTAEGPAFELTIRQARISDKGSYVCQVVEWLQDPHGDWYSLPAKSATTMLTVTEPSKIFPFQLAQIFKCNITCNWQNSVHTIKKKKKINMALL